MAFNHQPIHPEKHPLLVEDNVEYFNLEFNVFKTSLVINASKRGINKFLKLYGMLETPPATISFEEINRPQRKWASWKIEKKTHVTSTDPSPYMASSNNTFNRLANTLRIQYSDDEKMAVCAAGMQKNIPLLIVNKKGWKRFLAMLKCLRDQTYWFFVTIPNPIYGHDLPFLLSDPYPGSSDDHVFKALEFIRLEPDDEIFLRTHLSLNEQGRKTLSDTDPHYFSQAFELAGTCAGLLLFSQWMNHFAESPERKQAILNSWEALPYSLTGRPDTAEPSWVYLEKVLCDSPYPIFCFKAKDDETVDVYIFGNSKGFKELADVVEEYAFNSDHDSFYEETPSKVHLKGDPTKGVLTPEGMGSLNGWDILGGGLFSPKYYPPCELRFKEGSEITIEEEFVNSRMILHDDLCIRSRG